MSIEKFASFSYAKEPTNKPYFALDKPNFPFTKITKDSSRLLSYYKSRINCTPKIVLQNCAANCCWSSSLMSAGSGEPQPKSVTIPKINRNNNLRYANKIAVPTLEEKPVTMQSNENFKKTMQSNGIGIAKFIEGKSFLVTGATGFLSQVFVEKMLRTAPGIRKIYLLIRAKDKDDAMKRLKNEILDLELFKNLREVHGYSFEEYVMSKVVPVVGNVCEPNIGMNPAIAYEIANEVDTIVNAAANTTFDARYDMALEVNTKGPCRLISFAKKCKKLKVLLHFSTAFANRDENGVIYEKPLCLEESLSNGTVMEHGGPKLLSQMDIDAEIDLALQSRESFKAKDMVSKLKELGLKRARLYGWPNTYSFTKAIGEMLMNDQRGDLPLVIVRPSIVESTYTEPFPGWIQGNRVMDPFVIYYGKGQLQGVFGDPDGYLNIVPADMAVNASLAAMAKHGIESKPGIHIYHVTSSVTKPLLVRDFFGFIHGYFLANPFTSSKGGNVSISKMKYFGKMDELSTFLFSSKEDGEENESIKIKRKIKTLLNLSKLYLPYLFYKGCLQSINTKKLMEYMSEEDKRNFDFDFEAINWEDYMSKVHIPGVKKHVLKGREIF